MLLIKKTKATIEALKKKKSTIEHLRMFLSRLAMRFHNFIAFALNDIYHEINSIFFSDHDNDKHSTRLRVLVHLLNISFSNYIKQNEQKRKIIKRELNIDCDVKDVSKDN